MGTRLRRGRPRWRVPDRTPQRRPFSVLRPPERTMHVTHSTPLPSVSARGQVAGGGTMLRTIASQDAFKAGSVLAFSIFVLIARDLTRRLDRLEREATILEDDGSVISIRQVRR